MPCDTIQTVSVKFGTNTDRKLLEAAFRELGQPIYPSHSADFIMAGNGWVNVRTGESKLPVDVAEKIKAAYSRQVVLSQAKRYGWQMKETGPNKWQVVRR